MPTKVFVLGSFVQACCWQVERLPLPGESLLARGLLVEPGGKGLNVAVGCRRLDAEVGVLLAAGEDMAAEALLGLLHDEGLSAEHLHRFPGPSASGAGFIGPDGQNMIVVFPGPNHLLDTPHVAAAEAAIRVAHVVYGHFETSLQSIEAAFSLARAAGATTMLNLSPWQAAPAALQELADIVLVNEAEAAALLGLPSSSLVDLASALAWLRPGLAAFWAAWQARTLVVTLGALGSVAFGRDGSEWQAPAFRVKAVDATGAGDAFASGFCLALPEGLPAALRQGNACGAWVASRQGVLAALPGQEALQVFLQAQP